MSKKFIFVLVGIVFFCGFKLVSAEVIINEVQIAGSTVNDEFIELYNSDDSVADLTGFYIKKKTSTGSIGNFIVPSRFLGISISPGEYLLLARENNYTGSVTPDIFWPSSAYLSSNNSLILYRGNETDTDEASWQDIEESKSTQKTSSGWVIASPTPKAVNQDSGNNEEEDSGEGDVTDDEDSSSDSESETASETKTTAIPTIKTKILAKTLAFVGQPTEFSLDVKYGNLTYTTGKYFWNFGDGDSREVINQPGGIYHTYFYPGEYAVSLEYYRSYLSQVPDTVNKIAIKVVPLTVSISKVGDAKDFFIELTNNSSYEIDVSKWVINANEKIFVFPKNTVILPKKLMTVSGKITGFVLGDEKNLKLISSAGDVVFDYNPPIIQTEIVAETPVPAPVKISKAPAKSAVEPARNAMQNDETGNSNNLIENTIMSMPEIQVPVPDENLSENPLASSPILSDQNIESSKYSYLLWIGLFFFLGAGASIVYFVRRGRNNTQVGSGAGDDFSILDE